MFNCEVIRLIELKQGDCLELMKEIPDHSIDMILTDPPYGIDFQSMRIKDKSRRKDKILNDKKPFTEFIPELSRILKPTGSVMCFTRWDVQQEFIDRFNENDLKVRNVLIWDKVIHGMGDLKKAYGRRYESIIFHSANYFRFNGKRPQDIIRETRVAASKLIHPNEKPLGLLEQLITQCTNEGETVLDLFMGSGSTGVACVNTNRNFIGYELDENYFNIAKKRINESLGVNKLE